MIMAFDDLKAISSEEWRGCARVIFSPEELLLSGFSPEAIEATTEILESNFQDPNQTIFGRDGKPVAQMRGVVLYDLAVWIARSHKLELEYARGLNTTLDRIREAARHRLESSESNPSGGDA